MIQGAGSTPSSYSGGTSHVTCVPNPGQIIEIAGILQTHPPANWVKTTNQFPSARKLCLIVGVIRSTKKVVDPEAMSVILKRHGPCQLSFDTDCFELAFAFFYRLSDTPSWRSSTTHVSSPTGIVTVRHQSNLKRSVSGHHTF